MENIFNLEDFNSSDGMLTVIWGPLMWTFLHTMSFNYPVNPTIQQKIHYYKFLKYLGKILPCKYCRDNYPKNLQSLNFSFSDNIFGNRENFSRFIYNLHNQINLMLNKPIYKTFEQVREQYELFRSRCINQNHNSNIEKGCTVPFYGQKCKTQINIIPNNIKSDSLIISPLCLLKK